MRLLDLFCGAGGAAMGYHRAGFEVVGVDIKPQPHYPFEFHQADALTFPLDGFDAVHASPPCQPFTRGLKVGHKRTIIPDLLEPTFEKVMDGTSPWVIENVIGAPMEGLVLCGSTFGIGVRRHRIFASNLYLPAAGPCRHREQGRPVGVYHTMGDQVKGTDSVTGRLVMGGRTADTVEEAREAMGIDWPMTWPEVKEAIPPAYTEHIGRQLMTYLNRERAA